MIFNPKFIFMEWYLTVLKKYAVFTGRARRSEFWYFVLFNIIIAFVLNGLSMALGSFVIGGIYALAVFIPGLAVSVRRLHDTGRSGWWLLLSLIPVVGAIILIVFCIEDSKPGENQYGPNPKQVSHQAV
jgi:uncharacterized membrane protein YhaH (DUF805 family)